MNGDWDWWFFGGDVYKAFDCINREFLQQDMTMSGIPPEITAVVLQELQCHIDVHLGGAKAADIPYDGGGRQGGVSTPTLWRLYLHSAVGRDLVELQDRGVGIIYEVGDEVLY